jgi:hypothetical protein
MSVTAVRGRSPESAIHLWVRLWVGVGRTLRWRSSASSRRSKWRREKEPGLYGDGGGLYLQITARGSKSWIFRFWVAERDPGTGEMARDPTTKKLKGRCREMGLGSCVTVSLAEARERALECRKLRENGTDPIDAREAARRQVALERAKSLKSKTQPQLTWPRIEWPGPIALPEGRLLDLSILCARFASADVCHFRNAPVRKNRCPDRQS